jgi:hypothetical protein
MKLRARRLTLWIASLAILLAALAPGLLSLTAGSGNPSAPWHEVCTASGLLESAADEQAPSPLKMLPGKHCPWCTHHIWFALPPAPASLVRLAPVIRLVVLAPEHPPLRGAPPHHPAAPRGPPVIS